MRYLLFALSLLIFQGCATTNLAPISKNFMSEDDEKRLWARSEEEEDVLDKSGLIYGDEELESYLNEVAAKLVSPDTVEHIPIKIKVIKNNQLNAFAFPNGVIYIHTGILARMENEAQLATLIAHEMVHSTHRHMLKQFRDIKNKTAFLSTLQVAIGGLGGGVGDLATLLGTLGTMAAVSGYSKGLETEADMEGLKAIVAAGYDFNEAPKLFMHLKKEIEEEKIQEPFFFGTHPRIKERIKNYESFINEQYSGQKGGIINRELFLEKIKDVIFDNAKLDLSAGRFNIAKNGVDKYLGLNPDDAKAYCLLGEIFRQKGEEGDMEKAREYYQKAISNDPVYPESYKGMGLIFFKQGEKIKAEDYLEQYLSLSEDASDRGYIEEYIKQCNKEGGQ